jgi:hypothetical protein
MTRRNPLPAFESAALEYARDKSVEDLRITRVHFPEEEDSELDERQAEVTYQQTAAQIPPLRAAMRQAGYAIGNPRLHASNTPRMAFAEAFR